VSPTSTLGPSGQPPSATGTAQPERIVDTGGSAPALGIAAATALVLTGLILALRRRLRNPIGE
ncbi:hypothetical protein, partial [Leucobacter sp. M11]|uniref:hypothetical protein n=1 Tax=Leucobacter sp. M11 TaxID=2993565 RepID=UPI002D8006DB